MKTSIFDGESIQSDATISPAPRTRKPLALPTALRNGAVIACISLALLEIVLRLLGLTNPVLYERDPDVGYRLKPGQHVSYLFNEIVVNSYGVRDPRPLHTRDPGKHRVVCLGDSVTWGGIYERQERLFTSIAERKLGNTEVINAGVNGYSTSQMAGLYDTYLTGLEPDLVIFCVIGRDFERPPIVQLAKDHYAFPEHPPQIALVEGVRIGHASAYARYGSNWLRPPRANVRAEEFNGPAEWANMEAITQLAQKLDGKSKTIVALIPGETDRERRRLTRNNMRSLRRSGILTVDLTYEAGLHHGDFVDGVHLATSGHRKVGAALAAVIYEAMAPDSGTPAETALDAENQDNSRDEHRG